MMTSHMRAIKQGRLELLPKHGDEKIEKQDVGHHHVDGEEGDNEAVLLRTSLVVWIILT